MARLHVDVRALHDVRALLAKLLMMHVDQWSSFVIKGIAFAVFGLGCRT